MKNFNRENHRFSLCGLNCGLCTMYLDGYCPGCGGGEGNQSCKIARCSILHGNVEYCYQCREFPCKQYEGIDVYDASFITHQNRRVDIERAKKTGLAEYNLIQSQKEEILRFLLENYNDGRKKSFFCLAVNLFELSDLKALMEQIKQEHMPEGFTQKDKAAYVVKRFQENAKQRNIILKLRRHPK